MFSRFVPVFVVLLAAAPLAAHDLVLDTIAASPAVVIRARYAAAEPVANGDVQVSNPDGGVFLIGSTDPNGLFAFVPDRAGDWTVSVDDGFGHKAEQTVSVDAAGDLTGADSSGGLVTWHKLLVGLSLIFGVTGLAMWRRASSGSAG